MQGACSPKRFGLGQPDGIVIVVGTADLGQALALGRIVHNTEHGKWTRGAELRDNDRDRHQILGAWLL